MRRFFEKHWLVIFATLGTVMAACGGANGSASVSDGIPGTQFNLHTVFGWIQTETLNVDPSGTASYVSLMPQPLTIVASGGSFSATSDVRFASQDTKLQITSDQANQGFISITFPDVSQVKTGTDYSEEFSNQGAPSGAFSSIFTVGMNPLTNDSTPPKTPVIWGSKELVTVTFHSLGSKVGDSFDCTVSVEIAAGQGDPADALTGKITAELSGQLVNEQLGLCNATTVESFSGISSGPDCSDTATATPAAGG